MEKVFERATREKPRFMTAGGIMSTEDLWDLPLDSTTKNINLYDIEFSLDTELAALNAAPTRRNNRKVDNVLSLKVAIIKHIIDVRLEENAKKLQEGSVKEHNANIMEAIRIAELKEQSGKTPDELRALLK